MSAPTPSGLLPPGARVVIVWDQWLATKTFSGAPEPVTLRPLPADGQDVDGDGLPIVRDADDRLQASLHTWTTQPAAGDGTDVDTAGWVAFPALADDTAFGRWGGWELTYGAGADARTLRIGVPGSITPTAVSGALLTAVADTCSRTGATNPLAGAQAGDLVAQLYVYDAPRIASPIVITPDRVYTADHVDELVGTGLDELRAHVDDEDTRLRNLVGALTGDAELGGLGPLATSTDAALLTGLIDLSRLPSTVARVADVQAMFTALVGAAPDRLNTLVEIAAKLDADDTALSAITTALTARVLLSELSQRVFDLFVQGANMSLTRDPSTGRITIASTATGGSGSGSVSAADVLTIVANALGAGQATYNEGSTPKLTLTGTQVPDVADMAATGGTLRPAAARRVTVRRITPTTAVTVILGVPSGTPAHGAVCQFQLVNRGSVDISVNYESAMSNPSGQPFPVTLKAGTMLNGSMVAGYVADDATPKWTLLGGAIPETSV